MIVLLRISFLSSSTPRAKRNPGLGDTAYWDCYFFVWGRGGGGGVMTSYTEHNHSKLPHASCSKVSGNCIRNGGNCTLIRKGSSVGSNTSHTIEMTTMARQATNTAGYFNIRHKVVSNHFPEGSTVEEEREMWKDIIFVVSCYIFMIYFI